MNMKKIVVSITFVVTICIAAGIYSHSQNNLRRHYPYSGYSMLSNEGLIVNQPTLDRAAYPSDVSIEEVISMKRNCIIVSGSFLVGKDEAVMQDIAILPEKGSREQQMLEDTAESFGKEMISVTPLRATHYLDFAVEDIISGECEENEITIAVAGLGFELYPNVTSGTRAILLLTYVDGVYYNYSYEFFYVTANDTVLSAEKYKSLDKHSGTKYEDFVKTLVTLSAEYAKG